MILVVLRGQGTLHNHSLKTVKDTLGNTAKSGTITDQGVSSLYRSQREGQQDAAFYESAGVLDLPGDQVASGKASGNTAGTEDKRV